jgi:Ca-activated chloride channel family protein
VKNKEADMKKTAMKFGLLAALSALVAFGGFSRAQDAGILRGTVTDISGAPLPGVTLILTNAGTKAELKTRSDAKGAFVFSGLPPGNYELRAELAGFKRLVRKNLAVKAGRTTPVNLKMTAGSPNEEVVVGEEKSLEGGVTGGVVGGVMPARTSYPAQPPADFSTEEYDRITEIRFLSALDNPLSTFSIDVDTASYANVRRFLKSNQLPPKDAVRIEEMVNYFVYDDPLPEGDRPFSINAEVSACPWNPARRLVRIGLQGRELRPDKLPPSNLVFLIDVSGSMNAPEKLPLLKSSFKLLVDSLGAEDRVSIAVYAGAAGLVLPPTPGDRREKILAALENLQAGGSTAGGAGIELAYKTAAEGFIPKGNNRVILATDGDFNIGVSSTGDLVRLIEEKRDRGIFLTIAGFGMGNYKDSRMEKLADSGNGNYYYIDGLLEAKKVFVDEMRGTLFTIAKDVKIQVEFNPARVKAYRLVGYETRMLRSEDFADDRKDAGELGAGHTVTALYEVVPYGSKEQVPGVDELKYQQTIIKPEAFKLPELMTVKLRYKEPDGDASRLLSRPVVDAGLSLERTSDDFRFAAAVAQAGLLLRDSEFKGKASIDGVLDLARGAKGKDREGYRAEFIQLMELCRLLLQR